MVWLLALAAGLLLGVRAFARFAGLGLACRREVAPDRLFPRERARLTIEVENRKWLPMPWLVLREVVPAGVAVLDAGRVEGWPGRESRLVLPCRLGARQRLVRRFEVEARSRGVHRIGPASAWWTDPFGRREGTVDLPGDAELVVYPRLAPLSAGAPLGETPFGTRPRPGWIHQDPLQRAGVRPYQPGDPFRSVNWRATARTGELQVHRVLPAEAPSAALFVDPGRLAREGGGALDDLRAEGALSVAATLATRWLSDGRAGLAFFCRAAHLGGAAGTAQLRRVLECLARAEDLGRRSLEVALAEEVPRQPARVALWIVAARPAPAAAAVLARLRRPAVLFSLGPAPGAGLPPRVRVVAVSDDEVRTWFS